MVMTFQLIHLTLFVSDITMPLFLSRSLRNHVNTFNGWRSLDTALIENYLDLLDKAFLDEWIRASQSSVGDWVVDAARSVQEFPFQMECATVPGSILCCTAADGAPPMDVGDVVARVLWHFHDVLYHHAIGNASDASPERSVRAVCLLEAAVEEFVPPDGDELAEQRRLGLLSRLAAGGPVTGLLRFAMDGVPWASQALRDARWRPTAPPAAEPDRATGTIGDTVAAVVASADRAPVSLFGIMHDILAEEDDSAREILALARDDNSMNDEHTDRFVEMTTRRFAERFIHLRRCFHRVYDNQIVFRNRVAIAMMDAAFASPVNAAGVCVFVRHMARSAAPSPRPITATSDGSHIDQPPPPSLPKTGKRRRSLPAPRHGGRRSRPNDAVGDGAMANEAEAIVARMSDDVHTGGGGAADDTDGGVEQGCVCAIVLHDMYIVDTGTERRGFRK